ncbi:MAG: arginyltransferase [Spirochaetes bacterium]|nr:arginyltransferase [Spirochaetota bacterium]MBN2772327.1 arginyltransferase [Spirochaetota bacterium]
MIILSEESVSSCFDCPYIKGNKARYKYFHANNLSPNELDEYLSKGWRKFSTFYFKPFCPNCKKCIPIRIITDKFLQSKSQRRVIKKSSGITVKLVQPKYKRNYYEIYKDHSLRFDKPVDDEDSFYKSFFQNSCPAIISEYHFDNKLIAAGFIDVSEESFSSVYFIYYRKFENQSLGTLSVLAEIELARVREKKYYYLGYFIAENNSMNYKNRFYPHELFDWKLSKWHPVTK